MLVVRGDGGEREVSHYPGQGLLAPATDTPRPRDDEHH